MEKLVEGFDKQVAKLRNMTPEQDIKELEDHYKNDERSTTEMFDAAQKQAKEKGQEEIYEDIWYYDEDGKKKLNIVGIARRLIRQYNFITLGEDRPTIYYYSYGFYLPKGKRIIKREIQILTGGKVIINQVNEILEQIKRLTSIDEDIIHEQPPNTICVNNGILNTETLELIPHDPKKIFMQKININYKKEAKCPKIQEFLKQLFEGQEESIKIIQEFAGYCLYKKYNIKKSLIFVGEPDTGKTTLLNLLINVIGENNISSVSLHKITKDKFSSANLQHKLMNIYDDLTYKDIDDVGAFKIVTGGGYTSSEKKFGESFQFKNYAKLIFATNKISSVKDTDDDAYYNRWIILFFNNVFKGENSDKRLIEKIVSSDEKEGFLYWSLQGLQRLLKNNDFSYDKTSSEIKLIMERSSNPVSAFIQDCLMRDDGSWISKEDMYNIYSIFVNKFGGARVTKEKFGREFIKKALFVVESRKDTDKKKSVHGWSNISLNTGNTAFLQIISNIFCNDENTTLLKIKYDLKKGGITSKKDENNTSNTPFSQFDVKNGEKSDVTNVPKKPKNELFEIILKILERQKKEVEIALIQPSILAADFTVLELDETIEKMKNEGLIFEPRNGFIKKI